MTKRDLLSVAVKIVGLALILQMIFAIPSEIHYFTETRAIRLSKTDWDLLAGFPLVIASIVLYGVVGALLVAFGEGIARLLVRENADAVMPNLGSSPRSWFSIASRVVGLLAITDGLPLLAGALIKVWGMTSLDTQGWAFGDKLGAFIRGFPASNMNVVAYRALAQIIVGAYLLWGAEQFSRLVFRDKRKRDAEVEQDA